MDYPWEHHIVAALKGIDAFRTFLKKITPAKMHVVTLAIQNKQTVPLHLFIEPVPEDYHIPPGARYEIVALYWQGYVPLVELSEHEVTVWGADLWGIEVFHNGVTLFQPAPGWIPPADEP